MAYTEPIIHAFIEQNFKSYSEGKKWLKETSGIFVGNETNRSLLLRLRIIAIQILGTRAFHQDAEGPCIREKFDAMISGNDDGYLTERKILKEYLHFRKSIPVIVVTTDLKVDQCGRYYFSSDVKKVLKPLDILPIPLSQMLWVQIQGRFSWQFISENNATFIKFAEMSTTFQERVFEIWEITCLNELVADQKVIDWLNFFLANESFRKRKGVMRALEILVLNGFPAQYNQQTGCLHLNFSGNHQDEDFVRFEKALMLLRNVKLCVELDSRADLSILFRIIQRSKSVTSLQIEEGRRNACASMHPNTLEALVDYVRSDSKLKVFSGDIRIDESLNQALIESSSIEVCCCPRLQKMCVEVWIRNPANIDIFLTIVREVSKYNLETEVLWECLSHMPRGEICRDFKKIYEDFYTIVTPEALRVHPEAYNQYLLWLSKIHPALAKPFTITFHDFPLEDTKSCQRDMIIRRDGLENTVIDLKLAGTVSLIWRNGNSYLFNKHEFEIVHALLSVIRQNTPPLILDNLVQMFWYAERLAMDKILELLKTGIVQKIRGCSSIEEFNNLFLLFKNADFQVGMKMMQSEHLFDFKNEKTRANVILKFDKKGFLHIQCKHFDSNIDAYISSRVNRKVLGSVLFVSPKSECLDRIHKFISTNQFSMDTFTFKFILPLGKLRSLSLFAQSFTSFCVEQNIKTTQFLALY